LRDLGEEKEVKRREDEGLEHLGILERRGRTIEGEQASLRRRTCGKQGSLSLRFYIRGGWTSKRAHS
jgi:hypothetical protein